MNTATTGVSLDQYRWKKRLLLLVAPSVVDASYLEQQRQVERHADGLAERDMLVLRFLDDPTGGSGEEHPASGVRGRFDLPGGAFALLLIGKDGTVKRRADAVTPLDDIFAQVDSMPMRQEEQRDRAGGAQ